MANEYKIKSKIPFTMASLTLLLRSVNIADSIVGLTFFITDVSLYNESGLIYGRLFTY